ncbi:MerR family transcriptional regulator [Nocardioides cynanchi]|uniref:MerR family transcriptional regulator n=1 Tax=Nocardioides cynanchi TaxID=2558918 RepID=UPI0012441FC6|nr:MerR family transcriptional regulator [Nocardioides cynanchi]
MQVSELAARADVPVATVKYYLREGLLPPGETTAPRRAEYDESHVRRLRILRLLREIGGVPVSHLRQVMDALDDEDLPIHDVMTVTADVITAGPEPGSRDPASTQIVDAVLDAVGWDAIRPESVDRQRLESLVTLLNAPGPLGASVEVLSYYAGLADQLARTEITMIDESRDRADLLEDMVTGSVVYGQVFILLRQLGHEHHHARLTRGSTDDG